MSRYTGELVFESLNDSQRDAVAYGDGPLLVVAGAGTGKTLTLACRVASLIQRGVPPERILLLTFTRRAAREMLGRAQRMTRGDEATGKVWGGTFHAVSNRLLRLHGRPLGIRPDFTVMDQSDAADFLNLIRGELGLGSGARRFPRKDTLAAIYSRTVNAGTKLTRVLQRDFPWCVDEAEGIRSIFKRYTERKRSQNLLDYDDLLLYWKALASSPGPGDILGTMFDHILVDEYQDTNALQGEILSGMRREIRNLTVVGDDAQSIYSFRSATNRNILDFPSVFPEAHVVRLEQNYRSTQPILDASNSVIALSPQRHQKTLWSDKPSDRRPQIVTCLDDAEQCEEVCRLILEHREQAIPLKQQAVLFRAAHHSDRLEVELARRNVPFIKYGGLKFLEAAHVKDMLALLRILENPVDEISWYRILQLLDGVGPGYARRLMEALGIRHNDPSAGSPLRRLLVEPPVVPLSAQTDLGGLRQALEDCSGDEHVLPPAGQVERLRRWLEPIFERLYAHPRERLRDLEQLGLIAGGYPTRARFIADLTLDPPSSTGDLAGPPLLDEDYVILSTIHSAKGCEWDVVYVIHAADGMIPSDMATGDAEQIEEERRLLYVALTRARDALYVMFPLRYYRRPRGLDDAHSYGQLTRFLPGHVRELFDQRSTYVDGQGEGVSTGSFGRVEVVESFLAGLWSE
jgi:DNA helicase-2/ATP-dependent DNA helicase PcrA